jgi:periplasmic protein TonB
LRHHDIERVAVGHFRVAVDRRAKVGSIEPTSEPAVNRLLLDALKKWRFFPAMENGSPVAATIDIRIPISVR